MKYIYKYKHKEEGTFKEASYYDRDRPPGNDELVLNGYELDPHYEQIGSHHVWELVEAEDDLVDSRAYLEKEGIDASEMSLDEIIRTTRILQVMGKQGKGHRKTGKDSK